MLICGHARVIAAGAFALGALFGADRAAAQDRAPAAHQIAPCGPSAAAVIAEWFDLDLSDRDLEALADAGGTTSLAELAAFFERCDGVRVEVFLHHAADEPLGPGAYALLLDDGSDAPDRPHHLVAAISDGETLRVIDASLAPGGVDPRRRARPSTSWTGAGVRIRPSSPRVASIVAWGAWVTVAALAGAGAWALGRSIR